MSLSKDWFVDFDKDTLESKMQSVNFGIYAPAECDILPNDLKKVQLSHVSIEHILMKHFISQLTAIHNFLSTEAIANDDKSFQRYARKMLNYIKAEVNYCFNFWQNEKYLDFIIYRLDATLLRTYYLLFDLHKNVVKRKPTENRSYWSMSESLEELSAYLALRHEDLVCLIQYFEKAFEDLYDKVAPFSRTYPLEVNLVIAIWTISNLFMEHNFEEIKRCSSSKFSSEEENKLKQTVITSNLGFRKKKNSQEKSNLDVEKDMKQYLLNELLKSRTIPKKTEQSDQDISYTISKPSTSRVESTVRHEQEQYVTESMMGSNFIERLKESTKHPSNKKKLLEPKVESSFDSSGLSSVSSMKFSTLTLSQLSSIKESPNNPLAINTLVQSFISETSDEHDLRIKIAKDSKMVTRQNIISHFNKDILYQLQMEELNSKKLKKSILDTSVENNQKRGIYGKNEEDNYLRMIKSGLAEELYTSLIGEANKEQQTVEETEKQQKKSGGLFKNLKVINGQRTMIPVEQPTVKKKSKRRKKKKGDDDDDDDGDGKSGKKNKFSKKKQKEDELMKMAAETVKYEQINYHPSKENKGDDIPDEEALGDLIEGEESRSGDEDEDEDHEEDEDEEGASANHHEDEEKDHKNNKDQDKMSENHQNKESESEGDDNGDSEDDEKTKKKKKEKMLKKIALAQQNIPRNEFQKSFEEAIQKEPKNLSSRYFIPGKNFLSLGEDIDINRNRHKSKWCFLQDNYQLQNVERTCFDIKNEDFLANIPKSVDRTYFNQALKRSKRKISKPFQFAKQNQMALFQEIFGVLPIIAEAEKEIKVINVPDKAIKK